MNIGPDGQYDSKVTDSKTIADAYLAALEAGDIDEILSLFAENATVISPIYGIVAARPFFENLMAETRRSRLTRRKIFKAVGGEASIAISFNYEWAMANGEEVSFPVVDVMELDDAGKIERMTIHYDASDAKEALAKG